MEASGEREASPGIPVEQFTSLPKICKPEMFVEEYLEARIGFDNL